MLFTLLPGPHGCLWALSHVGRARTACAARFVIWSSNALGKTRLPPRVSILEIVFCETYDLRASCVRTAETGQTVKECWCTTEVRCLQPHQSSAFQSATADMSVVAWWRARKRPRAAWPLWHMATIPFPCEEGVAELPHIRPESLLQQTHPTAVSSDTCGSDSLSANRP